MSTFKGCLMILHKYEVDAPCSTVLQSVSGLDFAYYIYALTLFKWTHFCFFSPYFCICFHCLFLYKTEKNNCKHCKTQTIHSQDLFLFDYDYFLSCVYFNLNISLSLKTRVCFLFNLHIYFYFIFTYDSKSIQSIFGSF